VATIALLKMEVLAEGICFWDFASMGYSTGTEPGSLNWKRLAAKIYANRFMSIFDNDRIRCFWIT